MSKTSKRSKTTKEQPKPVRMGVPTVGQRLDMIERAIEMVAAGLGVDYKQMTSLDPKVQPVSLQASDVVILTRLLSGAYGQTVYIGENVPADILSSLAPTDDQRAAFEPLEVTSGAR